MKLNMKRVLLVLCMVTCLFALSACSKAADTAADTIEASTKSGLEQLGEETLRTFSTMSDDQLAAMTKQAEDSKDTVLASGIAAYEGVKDDLGALISIESSEAKTTDDGYMVTVDATFEKRKASFSIGVNEEISAYSSMSFSPVYTTGENMTKAAMNTLMGMGTVFMVLIFISLLISCFKYISVFENKMKEKNAPAAAPAPVAAAAPAVVEEELTDDLELVAVITAAIAASTGASADGLVVRSIKRSQAGKWKKAF